LIYIISGVAKSGKTYLTKKILKKRHISSFSTDYLMMSLSLANPNLGVNHLEDDKIVAKNLEPYLYSMISTMIQNGIDYLIEGVHFYPEFSYRLLTDFSGKIKLIMLGYAKVNPIEKVSELQRYQNDIENCWYKDYSYEELKNLVLYLISVSKELNNLCLKFGIQYHEITNIKKQSNKIIRELFKN